MAKKWKINLERISDERHYFRTSIPIEAESADAGAASFEAMTEDEGWEYPDINDWEEYDVSLLADDDIEVASVTEAFEEEEELASSDLDQDAIRGHLTEGASNESSGQHSTTMTSENDAQAMTKEDFLRLIHDADPRTVDRLLLWVGAIATPVAGNLSPLLDPLDERIEKHLRWLQQGSILDLDDAQYARVLDWLIQIRADPEDPDDWVYEEDDEEEGTRGA